MAEENKVRDATDAVAGLVKAVPIYQDLVQPAARELGDGLGKTIHTALAPVRGLVWGFDEISRWLHEALSRRLSKTPAADIGTPRVNVAGPAIEALRFAADEPMLREMYANLLATSMTISMAHTAHPAYVEILKQLSPDEARLLKWVVPRVAIPMINFWLVAGPGEKEILKHYNLAVYDAECERPELSASYVNNLCRLGLLEVPPAKRLVSPGAYDELRSDGLAKRLVADYEDSGKETVRIEETMLSVTSLGTDFFAACVAERWSDLELI